MKLFVYIITLILFVFPTSSPYDEENNEYVQVSFSLKPDTLRPGSEAKIFIQFLPQKGIHINIDPPIELEIDKKVASKIKFDYSKNKSGEYLDHNKPVVQTIKLNKNLKIGKSKLKIKLTYFYCSEEEGWCSRANKEIDLNFILKK